MEWLQGYTLWVLVAAGLFLAASIDLAVYFLEQQSRKRAGYPARPRPARVIPELACAGVCLLAVLVAALVWTIPRVWKGGVWMFSEHWFITSFLIALASAVLAVLLSRRHKTAMAAMREEKPPEELARWLAPIPLIAVILLWLWVFLPIAGSAIKRAGQAVWFVLWDLPLKINDLPPFNGQWPFVGHALRWLITIAAIVIVVAAVIQFTYWLVTRRKRAKEIQARGAQARGSATGQEAAASAEQQLTLDRFHALIFTVPFQHSAGVFWYFFGRGKIAKTVDEGLHVKFPWIQIIDTVDRQQVDIEIGTPQLPAGKISPVSIRETPGEAYADDALKRLELARGRERRVSGTLSYVLRMTVAIRSAKKSADYDDGIRAILRSKPEYRILRGTEVRERFTDLISARLREIIALMPFEDAFFVPPMILLLGNSKEMAGDDVDSDGRPLIGIKRWDRYLNTSDADAAGLGFAIPLADGSPLNLFKIDLNDPDQVVRAVTMRRHSLLATFFSLGYKLTRFGIKDVNPPDNIQEKLVRLANVELERDAKLTEFASEFVDKANAERGGRNIQADASNYTFRVFLEAAETAFRKYNPGQQFQIASRDIMQFMQFLEDRRTRRLMSEKEGRYTQIDISPDSPIPAGFAPFFAMMTGATPPRLSGGGADESVSPPNSKKGTPDPAAREPKK